jgi:hypothetical protein
MRKTSTLIIKILFFIMLNYIWYKISYPLVQDYIFPFRFEDDGDFYFKSIILALVISFLISIICTFIFVKLLKKKNSM